MQPSHGITTENKPSSPSKLQFAPHPFYASLTPTFAPPLRPTHQDLQSAPFSFRLMHQECLDLLHSPLGNYNQQKEITQPTNRNYVIATEGGWGVRGRG